MKEDMNESLARPPPDDMKIPLTSKVSCKNLMYLCHGNTVYCVCASKSYQQQIIKTAKHFHLTFFNVNIHLISTLFSKGRHRSASLLKEGAI